MSQRIVCRRGISRVDAIVLIVICAFALTFLVSCARRVRTPSMRTQSANNMRVVITALHSYHDVYKRFPPAFDKAADLNFPATLHVYLLPFVEQEILYRQFGSTLGAGASVNASVPIFVDL